MSRRIPVVLMVYTLENGGTERQVTEIAKFLDRAAFEPHVVTFHRGEVLLKELEAANVPVLILPFKSFLSWSYLRSLLLLRAYMRRHSIEVIHTFDPTSTIFATFGRFWLRIPVLLSSQRAYRELARPLYRRLLRVTDLIVNGIVVNCEAMRAHLIHDEHVSASHINVCCNAIDTGRFHPALRCRQGFEIIVGSICVLRPEKDILSLLAAVASLRSTYPGLRVLIIGDGPRKPVLINAAADLRIQDICRFEPYQSDVENWLPKIDIFVLPSLSEALSNSLMEAMACECCCVGSRIGGTPELLSVGRTGMLFEPGDAIGLACVLKKLLDDPDLRDRLRAAASQYIGETFSTSVMIRRIESVYRNSVGSEVKEQPSDSEMSVA